MDLLKPGIYENEDFPCKVVLINVRGVAQQQMIKFNNLFGFSEYMVIKKLDLTTAAIIQDGLTCTDNKNLPMEEIVALVRMDKFKEGQPKEEAFLKALNEKHAKFLKDTEWETGMVALLNPPVVPEPIEP